MQMSSCQTSRTYAWSKHVSVSEEPNETYLKAGFRGAKSTEVPLSSEDLFRGSQRTSDSPWFDWAVGSQKLILRVNSLSLRHGSVHFFHRHKSLVCRLEILFMRWQLAEMSFVQTSNGSSAGDNGANVSADDVVAICSATMAVCIPLVIAFDPDKRWPFRPELKHSGTES
jgi:hypothetical protein